MSKQDIINNSEVASVSSKDNLLAKNEKQNENVVENNINNTSINEKQNQIIEVNDNKEVENVPKKKKRVYWIDFLRIFASYVVILTHACLRGVRPKFFSYNWKVLISYNSVSASTAVPYFIMISGILFLNPKKKITIKTVFSKYVLRMFKAYVFWILFYALIDPLIVNGTKVQFKDLLKNIIDYFCNSYGHLWYLNFVFGLYMATPVFKLITPDRQITWYFILICSIVELFIPNAYNLLTHLYEIKHVDYIRNFVNSLKFEMAGGNIFYFFLGYMLDSHKFSKKIYIYLCYVASFIGFLWSIYFRLRLSKKDGKDNFDMIKSTCLHSAISAAGVLLFFKHTLNKWIERIMENEKVRKIVLIVSECTFGIYLIHASMLNLSFYIFNANTFNPLFWAPLYSFIIFWACFAVIYVMRKVPILRDFT